MSAQYMVVASVVMAMTAFAGCAGERAASSPSPQSQQKSSGQPPEYPSTGIEFWDPLQSYPSAGDGNAGDRISPEEERKAIAVAKEYLNRSSNRPVQGDFQAVRTEDGYSVFVVFHFGYDDQGRPLRAFGGHCSVLISEDWKVIRVVGGA